MDRIKKVAEAAKFVLAALIGLATIGCFMGSERTMPGYAKVVVDMTTKRGCLL